MIQKYLFLFTNHTKKYVPYFEYLSGMENVINKPCLCQLEQAICCLPKPLSEQRKQIFLVERGAESPTGADWNCVLSSMVPLQLPLLESVGTCSHPRRQDTFFVWTRGGCALPASYCRAAKTRIGKSDTCTQAHAVCALVSTPFPAFPILAG